MALYRQNSLGIQWLNSWNALFEDQSIVREMNLSLADSRWWIGGEEFIW